MLVPEPEPAVGFHTGVDHFAQFRATLGIHGLSDHPLDDVSSYQAALTALEQCPPPDPLDVARAACRARHIRSLHGSGAPTNAPLARDSERVRRAITNDWHQYEQIVVNHVNHLDASAPAGEDGADPTAEDVDRAAKAASMQKHLKLLQSSLTQIRDVANAAINPDVTTVAASFGYADAEYVRAFKRASDAFDTSDERLQNARLCDVARVVGRELRCFYAQVYATQVDAAPEATRATTEFFRDKWADGRNTVRAVANAARALSPGGRP